MAITIDVGTAHADGDRNSPTDFNARWTTAKSSIEDALSFITEITDGWEIKTTTAAAGSILTMMELEWDPSSGNMTDNSSGIGIDFLMPDDANNQDVYATIAAIVRSDANGAEEGEISIRGIDGGSAGTEWLTISGAGLTTTLGGSLTGTWSDLGTVTTIDINGGSIDGAIIGGASVAAGSFAALVGTTITGSGVLSIDDTTESTSTTTGSIHTDGGLGVVGDIYAGDDIFFTSGAVQNYNNGDVTWTHAAGKLTLGGDGAVEIDFNNHEMTNVDINSGAIDGTAIGAASAAAITGTTITGTSFVAGNTTIASNTITQATGAALNIALSAAAGDDFTVDTTKLVVSGDSGNVGVGTAAPLYALDVEANVNNYALHIDNAHATTPSVLRLEMSGVTLNDNTNRFIYCFDNATDKFTVFSSGTTMIGTSTNANMTKGLTIKQPATVVDEAFALKHADVAHSITDRAETDTYALLKVVNANGGLEVNSFMETGSPAALIFRATATDDNTAKNTGANAVIYLDARKRSGTDWGAQGADANSVVIASNGTARFIFDTEGSAHADVEWTTFNAEDDIQIIKDIESTFVPDVFGEAVRYKESDLERLGLFGKGSIRKEPNGKMRGMMNQTKMLMVHHGAIHQMAEAYESRIKQLETQVQKLLAA